jgi:hypothetical protein
MSDDSECKRVATGDALPRWRTADSVSERWCVPMIARPLIASFNY